MKLLNTNSKQTIKQYNYRGMRLCKAKGNKPLEMRTLYLNKIINVVENAVEQYPRTFIVRVELRFPQSNLYDTDGVMKRFIESLKSQIDADIKRKRKFGKKTPSCYVRYVWAREIETSINHHYHMALFFNKDVYSCVGKFNNEANLSYRIKRAWCSALDLDMCEADGLIEFPSNHEYRLNKHGEDYGMVVENVFERLSYFAKVDTKVYGNRRRNFGYSLK
ncbi:hypothetical protein BIY22_07550 [Vibrio panuliri]|uniref:YagK/YfjJ C-terminal domain-containing protein n=1 Tax=Vibrio panuliri TaxID=1381081 RepID=A0A1Q9HEE6_9VIBR|nr:inovirus Gp2 family protein [Vibrio panuliri]OLQ88020.1 hypothetical protein BIY22_07550 [Vibrio panuliri]